MTASDAPGGARPQHRLTRRELAAGAAWAAPAVLSSATAAAVAASTPAACCARWALVLDNQQPNLQNGYFDFQIEAKYLPNSCQCALNQNATWSGTLQIALVYNSVAFTGGATVSGGTQFTPTGTIATAPTMGSLTIVLSKTGVPVGSSFQTQVRFETAGAGNVNLPAGSIRAFATFITGDCIEWWHHDSISGPGPTWENYGGCALGSAPNRIAFPY